MISARSARIAARIASRKIFRFMPKYFLCGGMVLSNLCLSVGPAGGVVGAALLEPCVCSHSGTSTSLSIMDCEWVLLVMLLASLEAAAVQMSCGKRMCSLDGPVNGVPSRIQLHDGMRSVRAMLSKGHLIK
jgi:hypothetical protein